MSLYLLMMTQENSHTQFFDRPTIIKKKKSMEDLDSYHMASTLNYFINIPAILEKQSEGRSITLGKMAYIPSH